MDGGPLTNDTGTAKKKLRSQSVIVVILIHRCKHLCIVIILLVVLQCIASITGEITPSVELNIFIETQEKSILAMNVNDKNVSGKEIVDHFA